jgi:hypothetical protein
MTTDNTLPSGIHDLMRLGGEMAEGLGLHGPWLRMTQTPEPAFRAMLERLRQAEMRYGEARAAKGDAGKESTAADKVLTHWLTRARGFLTAFFGRKWSEGWLQIGASSRSTAIPKRMEPRIALARGVVDYFAKNPKHAYPVASLTAKEGEAIRERLVRAQRDLRMAKADCIVKKRARDAAERTLRRKMRQVVVILGVSIRRDDARWLDFGLNRSQRSLGEKRPAGLPAAGIIVETAALLSPETPSANDDVMAA